MKGLHGANIKGRTIRIESRGNKEAGISRTRLRSDKPGGGGGKPFRGKGDGFQGNKDRKGSGGNKSDGAPKYDWNAMFSDKPMRSEGKKKKKKK
jgi:hypothetical protein